MAPDADSIADCVLETYDSLPQKRKPRIRHDGAQEWVPLAGIVLAKDGQLSCVSLGTGMKCLPSSKLPLANGTVLHDWHAETLAIRAFNRFLLDQLDLLITSPSPTSTFLRPLQPSELPSTTTHQPPFTIKEDVKIFMYCSEAPCGDASMELIMDAQEDATPWTTPAPNLTSSDPNHSPSPASTPTGAALRGRSHFSHLGTLRYKPSRPDAPPTLSKSCTDKLAQTQTTSLLSSLTSTLISPQNAYIDTLILPSSQLVPAACERAFRARLHHVLSSTPIEKEAEEMKRAGYKHHPFKIHPTTREFPFSRRRRQHQLHNHNNNHNLPPAPAKPAFIASNLSAVCTPTWHESLIGGVLQGRKQFDARGASRLCRRSMWSAALKVALGLGITRVGEVLGAPGATYADVKASEVLEGRRRVKAAVRRAGLAGWVRNGGDDGFGLQGVGGSR